ncbi:MAG: hydratase/decarboxylase [Rhodocyclales bacterium]|nr:hydratase/decarboxylase [Rhodocyclales bacterium]
MNNPDIQSIASRLIAARVDKQPLTPEDCRALHINSRAEAYAVQAAVWQSQQGTMRPHAWKIGNSSDDPAPVRAAMPRVTENGSGILAADFRLCGIEAEIAVRFARDLPPRASGWSRDEVLAAIGSVHVAIEIVDTALQDYAAAGPFLRLADSMLHGGFVLGEALLDWYALPWHELTAQSFLADVCCAERTGGHPHVDPLALLPWWANEGSHDWSGVQAGDIVTTGTWNGMHFADHPARMDARFIDASGKPLASACARLTC